MRMAVAVLALLLWDGLSANQQAQRILLKDGTAVVGRVVGQDENKLIVETDYGRLEIPSTNVASVEFVLNAAPNVETRPIGAPDANARPTRYASGVGSGLVGGSVGFARSSGALHGEYPHVYVSCAPSCAVFVSRSVALGADISLGLGSGSYRYYDYSHGYDTVVTYTSTDIAICPKAMAMFGEPNSKYLPFIGLAFGYVRAHSSGYGSAYDQNGVRFKASLGLMMLAAQHVGIPLEFGLVIDRLTHSSITEDGMTLQAGIGLAGFLY